MTKAQIAAGRRILLAMLLLIALTSTSRAVPTNTPPGAKTPGIDRVINRVATDPSQSAWPVADRKDFADLLRGKHCAWLVAPAQVQKEGFDQAERSMTSAILGQALDRAGISVPDTYVVNRALGEGKRSVSLIDIEALAQEVGATTILVPYVGHEANSTLTLTLAVFRKPSASASIVFMQPEYLTWDQVPFSEETSPVAAISNLLPEVLGALRITSHGIAKLPTASQRLVLPNSPEEFTKPGTSADPAANAARFAVLGALAPPRTRGGERLFEKTLLAAQRAADSSERAFLQAYALFHLGLRPSALHALNGHKSHEISALTAILNGNVTGTQALVQQTSGYARLILELEFHDLTREYELEASAPMTPELEALARRSESWNTLLDIRWNAVRIWPDQDNVPLKQLLDQVYPVAGQSLSEVVDAYRATPGRELSWSVIQLSARQHIRGYMAREQSSLCCTEMSQRPATLDMLMLIDAWSDHRTMCVVDAELRMRGFAAKAGSLLDEIERFYSGDPEFEVLKAHVSQALASQLPQAERTTYLAQTRTHVYRAILGAYGQTLDAIEAIGIMTGDPEVGNLATGYSRDYPLNPYWLSNDFVINMRDRPMLARQALANTQTGVGYIGLMLLDGTDGAKVEGSRALRDRFLGNPRRQAIEEKLAPPSTAPDAVLASIRAALRANPENWMNYLALGAFFIRQDNYAEAVRAFSSFPGFSEKTPADRIGLSSKAKDAGDMLYWHGAVREARQMYLIGIRYNVGSEAEMIAATQLRLLDGDLPGALEESQVRAERYSSDASYGMYLSLLHILGRSSEAWKAFNLLVAHPTGAELWDSAMVGLRLRGTAPADLEHWLATPEISHVNGHTFPWSAWFQLLWSTTDRDIDADLAERIHALGREPRGTSNGDGRTAMYPSPTEGSTYLIIRSGFRADQRPILKDQTPLNSDSYYFSQALVALQKQDFSSAVSHFDEIAAHYPIERYVIGGDAAYALPEFAYASAKVGDPLKLESFVVSLPPESQLFETFLARAYFQALSHHDSRASLQSLQGAFHVMDHYPGRTPSMEYQYANAAERLYRETGDVAFRNAAVTWAHIFQTLQPWAAWAYAMEAELVQDADRRQTALVKALYLDPLSPRLAKISAGDIQRAQIQLAKGNPFQTPQKPARARQDQTKVTRAPSAPIHTLGG